MRPVKKRKFEIQNFSHLFNFYAELWMEICRNQVGISKSFFDITLLT